MKKKSLQVKCMGPHTGLKRVSNLNHIVENKGKLKPSKLVHINLLKTFIADALRVT